MTTAATTTAALSAQREPGEAAQVAIERHPFQPLLLIVLGTALWRWFLAAPTRVVWGDEPFYLWIGRNWLTGQGYTFTGYSDVHHTAGYPFLAGVFYLLTGDLELASRLLYVICGALLPLCVYAIAARLYDRHTGMIAALLTATWPALNGAVINWGTLTEPPYYLCIYAGLWVALTILMPDGERARGPGAWFATAALLTLAYHVRPEAIAHILAVGGYLGAVSLLVWWGQRRGTGRASGAGERGGGWRQGAHMLLPRVGAYLLGFALLWLPYGYYVSLHTGSWQISEKAGVTYVTSKSLAYGDTKTFDQATWGLDSTGREVFFFSHESYNISMTQVILADPLDFLKLLYQNVQVFLRQLLSNRLVPFFLVPLIGLGWFRRPWSMARLRGEGLLWMGILPVLAFLLFFIQERYIATLLPIMIVWVAHGLACFGEWLVATGRRLAQGRGPLGARWDAIRWLPVGVLVAGWLAVTPSVMEATSAGSWRPAHREIGLWLQPTASDAVVMSRYPAIAFHAEATKWVATPNASLAEIEPYVRSKQARYWVIDARELRLRPQFAPLLDGVAPDWLHLVHRAEIDGEEIVVYEVEP